MRGPLPGCCQLPQRAAESGRPSCGTARSLSCSGIPGPVLRHECTYTPHLHLSRSLLWVSGSLLRVIHLQRTTLAHSVTEVPAGSGGQLWVIRLCPGSRLLTAGAWREAPRHGAPSVTDAVGLLGARERRPSSAGHDRGLGRRCWRLRPPSELWVWCPQCWLGLWGSPERPLLPAAAA